MEISVSFRQGLALLAVAVDTSGPISIEKKVAKKRVVGKFGGGRATHRQGQRQFVVESRSHPQEGRKSDRGWRSKCAFHPDSPMDPQHPSCWGRGFCCGGVGFGEAPIVWDLPSCRTPDKANGGEVLGKRRVGCVLLGLLSNAGWFWFFVGATIISFWPERRE